MCKPGSGLASQAMIAMHVLCVSGESESKQAGIWVSKTGNAFAARAPAEQAGAAYK